ncbi:DUF3095 domain-containing protein [Mucilaginibacter terrae]|uniref:DUF3095 domain-containing protein n=1 Tax=Mucilaginibacter terrae TaxID=1955052 RepID=UPI0036413ECA
MLPPDQDFYSQLPISPLPLGDLLLNEKLFSTVPNSWHVIITDIKSSTEAVLSGSHENVNLIATGSIVSVLNLAFDMNITIPFFFGGDGATFIVPPCLINKAMQVLSLYKASTLTNFNLELRTGTVPVKTIYEQGFHLHIAKYRSSKSFYIPIILGNGLNYAEKIIKGDDYLLSGHDTTVDELNLTGMQCRWDKILPPENKEEVVTLLVAALHHKGQAAAFSKIMKKIEAIYGPHRKRQPISVSRLKLVTTFNRIGLEMRTRLGQFKWLHLVQTWAVNLFGHVFFLTRRGRAYLKSLVEMSDTLVIDGKINTVISGNIKQREALQQYLDELEASGEIIYGLHVSNASVMSCYVRDMKDGHIHFVDGSDGGYTQAARVIKGKLKEINN